MPYRNGKRKTWVVTVPKREGGWTRVSTGTLHRPTAVRIERMLVDLGARGRRVWDLLEAVAKRTLKLGELLDAWDVNNLDALRARLNDVDLEPFVESFIARHSGRVVASTASHYR